MSGVAKRLRQAADYVEKHGLHKGTMFPKGAGFPARDELDEYIAKGVKCCTVGALVLFGANVDEARIPLAKHLDLYLEPEEWEREAFGPDYTGDDRIPEWNDEPERTADDVVTALRAVADELEKESA